METDPDDGVYIDIPPMPEDGEDPLGWWQLIGGAWRWVTDPT